LSFYPLLLVNRFFSNFSSAAHPNKEDDLPSLAQLTVDVFGTDVTLTNGGNDLSALERALVQPVLGAWNGYVNSFAYTEILVGTRSRLGQRKTYPFDLSPFGTDEVVAVSASSVTSSPSTPPSIIFVVGRKPDELDDADDDRFLFGTDMIATVELRLQPPDAKIPFSTPWLDDIERRIARRLGMATDPIGDQLQPYLSNLAVAESARGRGIGKALVRLVESVVQNWGYDRLYLHVDDGNKSAVGLYKSCGFSEVRGVRWRPIWAGDAAKINYFVKKYSGMKGRGSINEVQFTKS